MPYSHFHDWSWHHHSTRPKGGRHWRAVRRRQRPWKIGLTLTVAGALLSLVLANCDWTLRSPAGF